MSFLQQRIQERQQGSSFLQNRIQERQQQGGGLLGQMIEGRGHQQPEGLPPSPVQQDARPILEQTLREHEQQETPSALQGILHGATMGLAGEEGRPGWELLGSIAPIALAAKTGGAALPAMLAPGAKAASAAGQTLTTAQGLGLGAARAAGTSATYNLMDLLAHRARDEEMPASQAVRNVLTSATIGTALGGVQSFLGQRAAQKAGQAATQADAAREKVPEFLRSRVSGVPKGAPTRLGREYGLAGRAAPATEADTMALGRLFQKGAPTRLHPKTETTRTMLDKARQYPQELREVGRDFPIEGTASQQAAWLVRNEVDPQTAQQLLSQYKGESFSIGDDVLEAGRKAAERIEMETSIDHLSKVFSQPGIAQDIIEVDSTFANHNYLLDTLQKPGDPTELQRGFEGLAGQVRKYWGSVSENLRALGDGGREIAHKVRHVDNVSYIMKERLTQELRKPVIAQATRKQQLKAQKFLEGKLTADDLTPEETEIAQAYKNIVDFTGEMSIESGVPKLSQKTGEVTGHFTQEDLIQEYFPRKFDVNLMREFMDVNTLDGLSDKAKSAVIAFKEANPKLSEQKIFESLKSASQRQIRGVAHKKGSFQYPRSNIFRELEVPDDFLLDPNQAIQLHINEASDVIAAHRALGPFDPASGAFTGIDSALQKLRAEHGDSAYQYAKEAINRVTGAQKPEISPLVATALNLNVFRLMGLSAISNVTQSINTASITGAKTTIEAIRKLAKNPKEVQEFASKAGALTRDQVSEFYSNLLDSSYIPGTWYEKSSKSLAELMMQKGKFSAIESNNQMIAGYAGGKIWGPEIVQKAHQGIDVENTKRVLKNAGIDAADAISRGSLTNEQQLKLGAYVLNETQFPRSILDMPLWTQSQTGKLLSQFSRFIYRQTKFIKDHVLGESQKYVETGGREGSVAPFITYATIGPALGYGVGNIRDLISGRDRPEGFAETYLDSLGWVGGFGMWGDVARGLQDGGLYGLSGIAAGPTFGDLMPEGFGIVSSAYQAAGEVPQMAAGDPDAPDEMRRRLGQIAGHTMSTFGPSAIARPLRQGELPGGVEVPALQRIMDPESYDPTGRKEASRLYNEAVERVDEALVDLYVHGNDESLMDVYSWGDEEGVVIDEHMLNNRLESPNVQLQILRHMILQETDPMRRDMLRDRIQQLEEVVEYQRHQSVPTAARGLIDLERHQGLGTRFLD